MKKTYLYGEKQVILIEEGCFVALSIYIGNFNIIITKNSLKILLGADEALLINDDGIISDLITYLEDNYEIITNNLRPLTSHYDKNFNLHMLPTYKFLITPKEFPISFIISRNSNTIGILFDRGSTVRLCILNIRDLWFALDDIGVIRTTHPEIADVEEVEVPREEDEPISFVNNYHSL